MITLTQMQPGALQPPHTTMALHAMIRFGLGRRGAEPLPDNPAVWLAAQLDGPDPALSLPGTNTLDAMTMLRLDCDDFRAYGRPALKRVFPTYDADTTAVMHNWLTTATPFRERLVWFWANHFTVSLYAGAEMLAVAPAFVRDAIRPHVNGRFSDMLLAVMRHPAMLFYLDNLHSCGADSDFGKAHERGLNENLARESLELHTIGPAAGYAQCDIIEYAKLLTGWSIDRDGPEPGFCFRPDMHEPGRKTVLGNSYPHGEAGGRQLLAWLAQHPATYHRLATKLVRHFVAEQPSPAGVARIEAVLRQTGGDLRAASLALIDLPEAWQPLTLFRTTADYVPAVLRAVGITDYFKGDYVAALANMDQALFRAMMPNGYPDTAADWSTGEALLRRVDWIHRIAPGLWNRDPAVIARDALGDLASAETLHQMHAAGSRQAALTLLLTAPEFMRR